MKRLVDFLFPRYCPVCGERLRRDEGLMCLSCNVHLPRTGYFEKNDNNPVIKKYSHEPRIKKAASFLFHHSGSDNAHIVYSMKYFGNYAACEKMGRIMALETQPSGFFDGIDAVIPIPLSFFREYRRGYNQSYHLAKGISSVTGIPVLRNVLMRRHFESSQTKLDVQEREANVKFAFSLRDPRQIEGKHVLLVDDVITTGSTTMSAAEIVLQAEGTTISIVSLACVEE